MKNFFNGLSPKKCCERIIIYIIILIICLCALYCLHSLIEILFNKWFLGTLLVGVISAFRKKQERFFLFAGELPPLCKKISYKPQNLRFAGFLPFGWFRAAYGWEHCNRTKQDIFFYRWGWGCLGSLRVCCFAVSYSPKKHQQQHFFSYTKKAKV